MNRQELIEIAKLQYDWPWIFTSIDFRKTATEKTRIGSLLTTWTRETSLGPVSFWTDGEENPAILLMGTNSDKMRWEKLDIINNFHTGGDWALLEHFVTSGGGLLSGPLAEIATSSRMKDLELSVTLPLEERLSIDPLFRKEYERNLRQIAAKKAAEITFAEIQGSYTQDRLNQSTDEEVLEFFGKVNLRELWLDETVEDWLVPDFICDKRGHVIYAEPGVGKSLITREVCACLATGKGVFGQSGREPISVLYIDHENIPTTDIRRSLIDMGFNAEDLEENFHLLSFPNFAPFDLVEGGLELMRVVSILKPKLVVMDTASRTVQGKENDNDTWLAFYNYTGKLLKKDGIAYIRIDHTGKDADAGQRGGSAKKGDVDLVWFLKEIDTEKVFKFINEKHRVPISKLEFIIKRELEPLRHVLNDDINWKLLVYVYKKHCKAMEIIEAFIGLNPTHQRGVTKMYAALKGELIPQKITKREFEMAHKEFFNPPVETYLGIPVTDFPIGLLK